MSRIVVHVNYYLAWFCWKVFGTLSYWKTRLLYGYGNEETAPVLYKTWDWMFNAREKVGNAQI